MSGIGGGGGGGDVLWGFWFGAGLHCTVAMIPDRFGRWGVWIWIFAIHGRIKRRSRGRWEGMDVCYGGVEVQRHYESEAEVRRFLIWNKKRKR